MEAGNIDMVFKIILDFILFGIVAFNSFLLMYFGTPYERGFFCNDESIRYPYKEDSITVLTGTMSLSLGIALILIVELVHFNFDTDGQDKKIVTLFNRKVPGIVQNLYRHIGMFLFVLATNAFLTDIIKLAVGRLRPHFFELCMPHLADGTTCEDPQNQFKYIEDYKCTNPNATDVMLINMRLSFPSGHASYAFASSTLHILYIQSRVTWKGSKLLKHFLQLFFVSTAVYGGLTRMSDHKHHWGDVLGGASLGMSVGLLLGIYSNNLFKEKVCARKEKDCSCGQVQQQV